MYKALFSTLICSIFFVSGQIKAQVIPYHQSNQEVYEFLEEMASLKLIQLNSAVLPLSRKTIFQLLSEAEANSEGLSKRQKKELQFYQQEFIKEDPSYTGLDFIGKGLKGGDVFPLRNRKKRYDLFHYKDSLFNLTVNAQFGGEGWLTNGKFHYQRIAGGRFFGSIGKHFGIYADIIDYHESDKLSGERFLNQRLGANYKAGADFSEMRGGITASVKWGYLALVKDHVKWGTEYHGSNIFSGRTPSFPMIKLHLNPVKWFSFDYIHGWLVSDVLDSAASYQSGNVTREVMRPKFLAANMFTVRPFKGLHFSFGNSVVYSDKINAVYLIPFMFYKSVDHALNSTGTGSNARGQNSQMFFNLVSRQIKYLQLYTSVFVDEIRLSSIFTPSKARNHISWKAGLRFTAPANINASLIIEYTRTNPFAYQHFISTTTFESNSYGLGHYLKNNAEEYYVAILYKPISRLSINVGVTFIRKGQTYPYTIGTDGEGKPFLSSNDLTRYQGNIVASYQLAQDVKFKLGYQYLKEEGVDAYRFQPKVFSGGNSHSVSLSFIMGI